MTLLVCVLILIGCFVIYKRYMPKYRLKHVQNKIKKLELEQEMLTSNMKISLIEGKQESLQNKLKHLEMRMEIMSALQGAENEWRKPFETFLVALLDRMNLAIDWVDSFEIDTHSIFVSKLFGCIDESGKRHMECLKANRHNYAMLFMALSELLLKRKDPEIFEDKPVEDGLRLIMVSMQFMIWIALGSVLPIPEEHKTFANTSFLPQTDKDVVYATMEGKETEFTDIFNLVRDYQDCTFPENVPEEVTEDTEASEVVA